MTMRVNVLLHRGSALLLIPSLIVDMVCGSVLSGNATTYHVPTYHTASLPFESEALAFAGRIVFRELGNRSDAEAVKALEHPALVDNILRGLGPDAKRGIALFGDDREDMKVASSEDLLAVGLAQGGPGAMHPEGADWRTELYDLLTLKGFQFPPELSYSRQYGWLGGYLAGQQDFRLNNLAWDRWRLATHPLEDVEFHLCIFPG